MSQPTSPSTNPLTTTSPEGTLPGQFEESRYILNLIEQALFAVNEVVRHERGYMSHKIFIDTNLLVSAYDRSKPEKQKQALKVLDRLAISATGVVSTQVLSEFFVAITEKIAMPLSIKEARERMRNHMQTWKVVDVTGMITLDAIRGVRNHSFNYWEALIWSTARLNKILVVFSEELHANATIEGVEFVNPFSPDFDIDEWM